MTGRGHKRRGNVFTFSVGKKRNRFGGKKIRRKRLLRRDRNMSIGWMELTSGSIERDLG